MPGLDCELGAACELVQELEASKLHSTLSSVAVGLEQTALALDISPVYLAEAQPATPCL